MLGIWVLLKKFLFGSKGSQTAKNARNLVELIGGRKETNPEIKHIIADIWKLGAGWNNVNESNVHNYDNEYPWSAAGLCYVMRKTHKDFPKCASHSQYVIEARERRKQGHTTFIAFEPHEYQPKAGDIIVKRRSNFTGNLQNIYLGAKTHGDIVLANNGNEIEYAGFNLGDTAKIGTKSAFNGYLTNSNHFAVIKM